MYIFECVFIIIYLVLFILNANKNTVGFKNTLIKNSTLHYIYNYFNLFMGWQMFDNLRSQKLRYGIIILVNNQTKIFYLNDIYKSILNLNISHMGYVGWVRSCLHLEYTHHWIANKFKEKYPNIQSITIKKLIFVNSKSNDLNAIQEKPELSSNLFYYQYGTNL